MWIPVIIATLIAVYVFHSLENRRKLERLRKSFQCEPTKHLPNSWLLPLGLDKLGKVIEAEKTRTYPLLMQHDHEKYGDTYSQSAGGAYVIITRDPRNVREMLSKQPKNFVIGEGRAGCVAPLLGDGIFTQDGDKWERSRKLLAPLILRPPESSLELVEKHFQRLLARIGAAELKDPLVVDLKEPLFDLSLDITTEFLLGPVTEQVEEKSLVGGRTSFHEEFARAFNTAFYWVSRRERLKGLYWLIDGLEFRRSCRKARAIVDKMVMTAARDMENDTSDEASKQHAGLARLLKDDPDPGRVRDQFLNLLLAGRDTSGSLLCWILYVLAREPGVFNAVKSEMCGIIRNDKHRKPTKAELNQMTTLDHFISETLRRFPPVPINCRIAVSTTTFPAGGGPNGDLPILVPAGTLIAFSTFATHMMTALYGPDASSFNMERWKDRTVKERLGDWSYHPFIGGPRKCLGERFALEQAKYMTCRFLQYFDSIEAMQAGGKMPVKLSGGSWVQDVKYHVGLTMSPDEGVWLRLTAAR